MIPFLIVLALCLGAYLIHVYNTVIGAKNSVDETASAIDVMLKNRFDLIPNIVASVKQYMKHEADLLTKLTEQRVAAITGSMSDKIEADNMFSSAMKSVFASAEAYPDLKASGTFINLQEELSEIEDKLQAARRTYNAAVKRIHDIKHQIPTNMFAGNINLTDYPYFEATEQEKGDVDVTELFEAKE